MDPSVFITYAMYIAIAYLGIRMFIMSKRNGKNKQLIDTVRTIENKEDFFLKVNALIQDIKDAEFENKGRVLKLWGCAYHQELDEFETVLNDVDISRLMENKKGTVSIDTNEDSFFYLYLAIPNMLHQIGRDDLRTLLHKKMDTYGETLKTQLSKNLSEQMDNYYAYAGDRGQLFFEKLMNGDYEGFVYSRTMIGLYKNIANATLYKIYQDQAKYEQLEEMKPMLDKFAETGVGKRWISSLDLNLAEKDVIEKQEIKEENLSETMVLEKLTDTDLDVKEKNIENLSETMVLEKLTDADLDQKDSSK